VNRALMESHSSDIARVIELAVAIVFVLALGAMIVSLGMFLREVYPGVSSGSHILH